LMKSISSTVYKLSFLKCVEFAFQDFEDIRSGNHVPGSGML